MNWIDTHTHIYLDEFREDRQDMVRRAKDRGIEAALLPNIDRTSLPQMMETVEQFPDFAFPMIGLHPCSVKEDFKSQLNFLKSKLNDHDWIAVGEIGLDLYWDKRYYEEQQHAFRVQLEWARSLQIPVSIHTRDAMDETIAIVKSMQDGNLSGVFHCFGSSVDQAKEIINLGFYLGIGGVVTYKKANLIQVLQQVGLDFVVLETDAPYLSPVPFRGKRNECAFIAEIGIFIAEGLGLSNQEVALKTTTNAKKVFRKLV